MKQKLELERMWVGGIHTNMFRNWEKKKCDQKQKNSEVDLEITGVRVGGVANVLRDRKKSCDQQQKQRKP